MREKMTDNGNDPLDGGIAYTFKKAPVMMFSIDSNGTILSVNDHWLSIFGYGRDEIVGNNYIDFLTESSQIFAQEIGLPKLIETGFSTDIPYQFRKKNSNVMDVQLSAITEKNEENSLERSMCILIDVTDRNRAQKALKAEMKRAEFYLDLLSHDISNIHQGILSILQLTMMKNNNEKDTKKNLVLAEDLVHRAINLIKNVQLLTTLKKTNVHLEPVDISEMVQKIINNIPDMFFKKKVTINFFPNSNPLYVMADPMVEELFINLIHNGIKFQREDYAIVDIDISEIQEDEIVKINISDHGQGISDEFKDTIFNRFSSEDVKFHSGIGLSLVKELVNRYGGEIEVRDRIEGDYTKGAIFSVSLVRGENDS